MNDKLREVTRRMRGVLQDLVDRDCRPSEVDLGALKEIDEQVASALAEPNTCAWVFEYSDGIWRSACGRAWRFIDDSGPERGSFKFCHECGRKIEVIKTTNDKLRKAAQAVIDAWKKGMIGHLDEPAITELDALEDTLAEPGHTDAERRVELLEKRISEFQDAEQKRLGSCPSNTTCEEYGALRSDEEGKKLALLAEVE